MSMIKCPECKKKISDQCGKCPNCGYPIETVETPVAALDDKAVENEVAIEEKTVKPKKERKPINKKLLIGIISAVVVLLAVGGIWGYNALLPRINATKDFEKAVKFVEKKNTELETEISQSEKLIAKKQPLLDDAFITMLENAISDAKAVKITDFKTPKEVADIISRTKELNKTDYSEAIENLNDKHKALEINARRYQLVNAPTEAYVIQCLKTISEIKGISAVTEDNDPNGNLNKEGGYTATVFFSHEKVKLDKSIYGNTIIEQGTDGGGAIEVYSCVEDATKRRDYLATFDGSILASGTHTVIGTVLIRTSNELTASQQKELETKIIESLIYIEEVDGKREVVAEPKKEEKKPVKKKPAKNKTTKTTSSTVQIEEQTDEKQEAIESAEQLVSEYYNVDRSWMRGWLIEVDGYSDDVAQYAIENVSVDWREHAKIFANECLDLNPNIHSAPVDRESITEELLEREFTEKEINYALSSIDWNQYALDYLYLVYDWGEFSTKEEAKEILSMYGLSQKQIKYAINNCSIEWETDEDVE